MAAIEFDRVTKRYADGHEAVENLSLLVGDGEFVILVGPSGCGKSTALRMIAGLEDVTEGELRIDGEVVNDMEPKDRDIAMVFQSYALYPHMTVGENMGFSLGLRKVPKREIERRVSEVAEVLELEPHLARKPAKLSGGQRQRVAMGRAIVREPSAFLMDEPLSNLDAKLRVEMRVAVSRLQQRLGTTTVYVTHDQTEAMTLGDRVAVMRGGVLQQVDSPGELYRRPSNLFVAGFIGSPAMNFLKGELNGRAVRTPIGALPLDDRTRRQLDRLGPGDGRVVVGVRPEDFEDASAVNDRPGHAFEAPVELTEAVGSDLYAHFAIEGPAPSSADLDELARDTGAGEIPQAEDGSRVIARLGPSSAVRGGRRCRLWLDTSKLHLFDATSGRALA
jgi:multiple sugar transport system ATP-binding protein